MAECCKGGMSSEACAAAACSLAELRAGDTGRIAEGTTRDTDLAALRALGLGPKVGLVVRRAGSPCIVEVRRAGGPACRIGLTKALARRVMVEPAGATA